MTRDKDFRMKLTNEEHAVLSELADATNLTMQAYVGQLLVKHLQERLDLAKRLVGVSLTSNEPKTSAQRLYFVQRGAEGAVKIGVAASVPRRLRNLQTGSHEQLRLLHECAQTEGLTEKEMHRRFRPIRLEGEWFKPDPQLMSFIDSLKEGVPT